MQRLVLKSFYSPGDIVMLTAAVRDLHRRYPRQFRTDVRTLCPEIWENNPFITALDEHAKNVRLIECSYPLINRSNDSPYHCLHGYIDFLNAQLGLAIQPTEFRGDIHISDLEKSWYSQVYEVTKHDIPFWVMVAGGKYDVTIKWWESARFQRVIDHFRGRIQFVQVGERGHHHPRLEHVIDFRGQTTLRQFIRLIYHSQGVLCPVTAAMHLAAAVPCKDALAGTRPCVVIAGGREPAHWEAYPNHQYIHTTGALSCCQSGGCWRSRVAPLRDGDERDASDNLCLDVVKSFPRCMSLITADEVIHRIETYFDGGALEYLDSRQKDAARRGVRRTASSAYDDQPLVIHNAAAAFERAVQELKPYPGGFEGRGIVICGGGIKFFPCVWVCINMLRKLGSTLPIELWHLGPGELTPRMKSLVEGLHVVTVDACEVRKRFPVRKLGGWELKSYAILHSRFREVLLLDADNVPVRDPEYLFETPEYRAAGAVFWPDFGQLAKTQIIWDNCGLKRPAGPEFESGQIMVDKRACWKALSLAMWFNENSDFYYEHLHGDKETFHLAFEKLQQPYAMPSKRIHRLDGTMCQHDFEDKRVFQHRNSDKWNLFLANRQVDGFWYEAECRAFLRDLQVLWDGGIGRYRKQLRALAKASVKRVPRLAICMISCEARSRLRNRTLSSIARNCPAVPLHVQLDDGRGEDPRERQTRTSYLALERALKKTDADYILFIEDDLQLNRSFYENLVSWPALQFKRFGLGSLYNPGVQPLACDVKNRLIVADPESIYGSQAFVISRSATKYILKHWDEVPGMQDIRISRLAARIGPVLYHVPSLVEHVGKKSTWGGGSHYAIDFDRDWHYCPRGSARS
jgi:ADP-heptose:LPS heptosyltransferase